MLDYNPKVNVNPPYLNISTEFSFDNSGNLVVKNPYVDKKIAIVYIPDEWQFVPVKFDGLSFEYKYKIFYRKEGYVPEDHTEYKVIGEIILNTPVRIKKNVFLKHNIKAFGPKEERLVGEVLYELR